MTVEPDDWTTPGGDPAGPGRGSAPGSDPAVEQPPRYGERVDAAVPPPAPAQPVGAQPQAPAGWRPPPKPGLVPLRPLGFSNLLGAAFLEIRHNPKPVLTAALLVNLVAGALSAGASGVLTFSVLDRIGSAEEADLGAITAGSIGLGGVLLLAAVLVSAVLTPVLTGLVVADVAQGTIGRKLTLRGLWARVRPSAGRLIGLSLLLGLAWLLAVVLVVVVGVAGFLIDVTAGVVGVVLALVLGAGAVVAAVWIGTRVVLAPSALVVERLTIVAAVRRSWTLTGGHFWRAFGLVALVSVIVNGAAQLITVPFSLIGSLASALLFPTGMAGDDPAAMATGLVISTFLPLVVTFVVTAVGMIAIAAAGSLLYLDLRMRKEGLDLVLQRHVEEGGEGDPFAAPPAAPHGS